MITNLSPLRQKADLTIRIDVNDGAERETPPWRNGVYGRTSSVDLDIGAKLMLIIFCVFFILKLEWFNKLQILCQHNLRRGTKMSLTPCMDVWSSVWALAVASERKLSSSDTCTKMLRKLSSSDTCPKIW